MANPTPEVDLATAIAAALSLQVGTDIKLGPARSPASDEATNIWVAPYGGRPPEPLLNAAVAGSYYFADVQVLVRGAADDYEHALVTARAVRDALHTKQPAGYVQWRTKSSEPLYIGPNESGQHQFVVNVTAEWVAAA